MSGARHRAYDAETGTIPLDELLADVDGRRALRVRLPYGTCYLRRPGQAGDFEKLLTGTGGGFVSREFVRPSVARDLVELGVQDGSEVEIGRDIWPSKWDGDRR